MDAADVATHLVLAYNHIWHRWRWAESAAVYDNYVDGGRIDACLGKEIIDGGEDDQLNLLETSLQCAVLVTFNVEAERRQARLLTKARSLEKPCQETDTTLAELAYLADMLGKSGGGNTVVV